MEDRVSGKGYEYLIIQEEGGKCLGKGKGQGHRPSPHRATWVSLHVLDGGLRTTALGLRGLACYLTCSPRREVSGNRLPNGHKAGPDSPQNSWGCSILLKKSSGPESFQLS